MSTSEMSKQRDGDDGEQGAAADGREAADLYGQPRDDADGSAGAGAMLPYFRQRFGNAASRNHAFGWEAEQAVETAREQIAKLIGCTAKEIIFTSGATESNNLAIKGIAEMYRERGNHIITQVTEHKAVLDTCKKLEKQGYRVTYLPVQADGLIDAGRPEAGDRTDKTILVSIMYREQRDWRDAAGCGDRQALP